MRKSQKHMVLAGAAGSSLRSHARHHAECHRSGNAVQQLNHQLQQKHTALGFEQLLRDPRQHGRSWAGLSRSASGDMAKNFLPLDDLIVRGLSPATRESQSLDLRCHTGLRPGALGSVALGALLAKPSSDSSPSSTSSLATCTTTCNNLAATGGHAAVAVAAPLNTAAEQSLQSNSSMPSAPANVEAGSGFFLPTGQPRQRNGNGGGDGEPTKEVHKKYGHKLCAFLGTEPDKVEALLDVLQLEADDVFYDLGCGDGRIVREVVQKFGCVGIGVELNPLLVKNAQFYARTQLPAELQDRISFLDKDIRHVSLTDAKVVFIYMPLEALRSIMKLLPSSGLPIGSLIYIFSQHFAETLDIVSERCRYLKSKSNWARQIYCFEWREADWEANVLAMHQSSAFRSVSLPSPQKTSAAPRSGSHQGGKQRPSSRVASVCRRRRKSKSHT